jgi:hypothetical protein
MLIRLERALIVVVVLSLALSACNMPQPGAEPSPSGAGAIYTAAAATIQAQLTSVSAAPPTAAATPGLPTSASATPAPGETPPVTPAPGAPTATPRACDQARFVADVTIPDDTEVAPGESFVKRWRLANTGSCTWATTYAVVFTKGDAMNAPAAIQLPREVNPGQEIEVEATMTAPTAPGTYRAEFKLRNAAGQIFGLGSDAKPFWAQIKVPGESGLVFDFLAQAGSAVWTSSIDGASVITLTFGGLDEDTNGVAAIRDEVTLENGNTSGKVLFTYPRRADNGLVRGVFPVFTVRRGDRLLGRLGFRMNPDGKCGGGKVLFQIGVLIDGNFTSLKKYDKTCDGSLLPVEIDLSALREKKVQFVLIVRAEGVSADDWAVWNSLRIERP